MTNNNYKVKFQRYCWTHDYVQQFLSAGGHKPEYGVITPEDVELFGAETFRKIAEANKKGALA